MLTARPNLTTKDKKEHKNNKLSSYYFLKIHEAHFLTLTDGPNQTTKEKTLSWNYLIRSTQETFCYGDVLLRRRFVTEDVSLRRRFVKETLCV
jgi:hypothetical protein